MGVMAQEVESQFPFAVDTDKDGNKFVHYDGLIPVLIEATKEQQEEIETLKTQNQRLKDQMGALVKRIEALEK